METNELELNRWAHSFVDGDQHDIVQISFQVMLGDKQSVVGNSWKCRKCGCVRDQQSHFEKFDCDIPIPDYCSSLDLAAKVVEKAVDGINIHYSTYQDVLLDIIKKDYDPDEWLILNNGYLTHLMITAPALTRVQAAKRAARSRNMNHKWKFIQPFHALESTKARECIHCGLKKHWIGAEYQSWRYSIWRPYIAQNGTSQLEITDTWDRPDCIREKE